MMVEDQGNPLQKAVTPVKIIVDLTDHNDNAPVFDSDIATILTLNEDLAADSQEGKLLLLVNAEDADVGEENSKVTYSLGQRGRSDLFLGNKHTEDVPFVLEAKGAWIRSFDRAQCSTRHSFHTVQCSIGHSFL